MMVESAVVLRFSFAASFSFPLAANEERAVDDEERDGGLDRGMEEEELLGEVVPLPSSSSHISLSLSLTEPQVLE